MASSAGRWFALRQVGIVAASVVAYFGVRGLTEGSVPDANVNAERLLALEASLHLDLEQGAQALVGWSDLTVTLANWVYIWLHWPVLIGTLWWLLRKDRPTYLWLRDAMIVSGAIGLVIFATLPVAPPRLFDLAYVDTVTERSYSYRVLQPPMFVNKYAAVPSLHFGWNLLVGIVWYVRARGTWRRAAAIAMPAAMAFAVVATGNHWVADVVAGGAIALLGGVISSAWASRQLRVAPIARTWPSSKRQDVPQPTHRKTTVASRATSATSSSARQRGQWSNGAAPASDGAAFQPSIVPSSPGVDRDGSAEVPDRRECRDAGR